MSIVNNSELLDRETFREGVFKRDGYKCVICGNQAQDAHHIIERRLWDECAGYFFDNGASLCGDCHMKAEQTVLSCEEIRSAAGITRVIIPDHLYGDYVYDKWGNIINPNGTRTKGELFNDESVQKVLKAGGVLPLFCKYVKYPRTFHLPWSLGLTQDDRVLPSTSVFEGREVVVTEKMDGECLAAKTWITMGDGSRRSIRDLVINNCVGVEVFGRDVTGQIVSTKITKTFNNGSSNDWLRVSFKGTHSSFHSIYCTSNEQFYVSGQGYTKASNLQTGCQVELFGVYTSLTTRQRQLITGKLLGDGSLHVGRDRQGNEDHNRQSAQIQWSHKIPHKEYIEWFLTQLGSVGKNICKKEGISGYGTHTLKAWSKSNHAIYEEFYQLNSKLPPLINFSPLSLAVFYMDDGNLEHTELQRDRAKFSVCDYSENECDSILEAFDKIGLFATKRFYKGYWYLSLDSDNSDTLFRLISLHVPPIMQYKLPLQYRGKYQPLPDDDDIASTILYTRQVSILNVDKKLPLLNQRIKYDLETGTHNFFANGILVHNCTTMYNDHIHARSLDTDNHESRGWVKNLHGKICYDIPEGFRICGENLYALHSIPYSDLPSYFLVFSIWDQNNTCLSWDDTVIYAAVLGLETVPVLWRGIWNEEKVRSLAPIDTNHHEGYVVRIVDSFPYGAFRKSVAKWVRKGHVQTTHNWKQRQIIKNGLYNA